MEATVSAPWMCEMSKHSMRRGSSSRVSASCRDFLDGLHAGLQHAEALVVGLLRVEADEVDERALLAALRGKDLDAAAGAFGQQIREDGAVREVDRHEYGARHVVLVQVELLQQGREKGRGGEGVVRCPLSVVRWVGEDGVLFGDGRVGADLWEGVRGIGVETGKDFFGLRFGAGVVCVVRCPFFVVCCGCGVVGGCDELGQVFPEEVAAVDDFASAHVEEVHRQHAVLVVEAEDIGVLVVGGGDALLVVHLVDGDDLVAQAGRELVLLGSAASFMRAVRRASSSLGLPSRKSCTSRTVWA